MILNRIRLALLRLLGGNLRATEQAPPNTAKTESRTEIHSIWDYLDFRENTQAHHLTSVIGFEELVDMDEVRRRIQEQFHIEYKNERSLYPYLKTLVDIGLFETVDVGGRRKWRKRAALIRRKKQVEDDEEFQTATQRVPTTPPKTL